MTKNAGIYFVIAAMALPLIWLAATTDWSAGVRGPIIVGGGIATYGWLVHVLWSAHARGALLPNRCKTCESPMAAVPDGAIKPPVGVKHVALPRWRCRRCGRFC